MVEVRAASTVGQNSETVQTILLLATWPLYYEFGSQQGSALSFGPAKNRRNAVGLTG